MAIDGLEERCDGWRAYHGGTAWRPLAGGAVEVAGHSEPPRTSGRPLTMRTLWRDFGVAITHHADKYTVPPEVIAAVMACEAGRRGGYHLNTRSRREEPGYTSDEATPHRVSVGVGQCLISTARDVQRRFSLYEGEEVDAHMLEIPERAIELCAGYLRMLSDRYPGADGVLLQAAYNAGRLRKGDDPFCLYVFDNGRTLKYIRYVNDLVIGVWGEEGAA